MSNQNVLVVDEGAQDAGFRRRPMARWAEDGSVAKPRGGKGGTFVRCLTSKQIETDLATILAAPLPEGQKRTRNRDLISQMKRHRPDGGAGSAGMG